MVLFSPYSPCFNLDEILAPWVEESNKSEDIPKPHVIPTKPRRSTSVDTGDQQLPNLIDLDEGQLDNIQFEMKPKATLKQKDFEKGSPPPQMTSIKNGISVLLKFLVIVHCTISIFRHEK